MSTSGTFVFTCNAREIVTEAMEINEAIGVGESISAADMTTMLRTLNMQVKQWSGNFDFAPGLKAFARKRGFLFPQRNQGTYSLGPTGDNATLAYVQTAMRVTAIAAATTLEVDSTAGMTVGDRISVTLNDGTIFWTTVASIVDADTLTIPVTGLTSAAGVDNRVITYTTKLMRPLYIESALLRDQNNSDTPLHSFTLPLYESVPNKAQEGTPSYFLYENNLLNGTLRLDCPLADLSKIIALTFMVPAEDINALTEDLAFPQEWLLPLAHGLAKLTSSKFGAGWDDTKESNFGQALAIARTSYAETSELYFQPGLE